MNVYQELEKVISWTWADGRPVVSCSSGTSGLHLALECLGLPKGTGVIVPDYTMAACGRAVAMAGLVPIFVDCRESDLTICPDDLEHVLRVPSHRWRGACRITAIMPVSVYGRAYDAVRIAKLAKAHHLKVIEDLAEAHGVRVNPDADASVWSFYRNKVVHGEEGGAIAFKDESAAEQARCMKNLGFRTPHDYTHVSGGYNYRLADTLAQLILDSFTKFPHVMALRLARELDYDELLPSEWRQPYRDSPWVYDLRLRGLPFEVTDRVVKGLREYGVEARHGFLPLRRQTEWIDDGIESKAVRQSDLARKEVLYLPLTPSITKSPIFVVNELKRLVAEFSQ